MKFVRIQNHFKYGEKSAYSLAELLLVMMLIVMLSSVAIGSILRTQATFQFNAATQAVFSIVREARSFAVTGKAQIDYTDYDGDGCRGGTGYPGYEHLGTCTLALDTPDYVTPANYGVYFDAGNNKLTMFADMHGSTEGVYDAPPAGTGLMVYLPGNDMHLAEYQLPEVYRFFLSPNTTTTVLFSPIFADATFSAPLQNTTPVRYFFVFGVEAVSGARKSCMAIQRVAGVPEEYDKVGQTAAGGPCGT